MLSKSLGARGCSPCLPPGSEMEGSRVHFGLVVDVKLILFSICRLYALVFYLCSCVIIDTSLRPCGSQMKLFSIPFDADSKLNGNDY